ncbi:hypothetical protein IMZ31_23495 (plasmid) [Pontibacillus sp. ALD_SL1]|uniref:hypothetical protein n=1 Tax=Pontibacillus sp. ALD_SL1 TaxID=2777185 RepID=UPI001A97776B|nr:hypothetical protein [Pontibacillus sp. ALD_SL1]QST02418.1 hypothetical protein IMZ31_23495 [Pontibacillus sp. ALD_SL1]
MNKTEILKAFNDRFQKNEKTFDDMMDTLSEEFGEFVDDFEDAQMAYDEIDSEYEGFISEHFVYSLSEDDETWSVEVGNGYNEEVIQNVQEAYDRDDLTTTEEVVAFMERKVMKDMDNAGCDPYTALRMNLEDVGVDDAFVIRGAEAEPRLELYPEV